MALQIRKDMKEPQWEIFAPTYIPLRGEYVVVQKTGAMRFSREAHRDLFGETERIAIYVDRSGLVGFKPVAASDKQSYKVSSQQTFVAQSVTRAMNLAPGRYALRPVGNLMGFDPEEDRI